MKLLSDRLAYIYEQRPDLEGERGQIGLVNASGASKSVVNQWLTDKIKSIDIRFALRIEAALGFSHIWLMTGEGEPIMASGKPHVVLAARDNTEEIIKLLSIYAKATAAGRRDIMLMAESVAGTATEIVSTVRN